MTNPADRDFLKHPTPSLAPTAHRAKVPLAVWVFVISLIWPASLAFQIGSLNMPIYKFVLVGLVPLIAWRFLVSPIRLRLADFAFLAFGLAQAVATTVHHGLTQEFYATSSGTPIASVGWENIGSTALEYLSPYFAARVFIRSQSEFVAVIRLLVVIAIAISATTWIESVTGFSIFGHVFDSGGKRLGLFRAAGPFPHPIHWGFFAASLISLAASRVISERFGLVHLFGILCLLGAALTSVSSSAILAAIIQLGMIGWLLMMRGIQYRWLFLVAGLVTLYILVDLLSNRTPIHVFFTYATLSPWNGYIRMLIWDFGLQNFYASPLIGIGFNNWFRASWMGPSVDAFWLLIAMRYGLLGAAPLFTGFISALRYGASAVVAEEPKLPLGLATAWMFSMVGFIVTGLSVHFWGHALVYAMFFTGLWGSLCATSYTSRIGSS